MKRIQVILLFMVLTRTVLFSQTPTFTIAGKIIDADTKKALKNAGISISNSLGGALSDSAGAFTLSVSGKSGILNISLLGYEKRSLKVSEEFTGTLTIELTPKINTLAEISINASPVEVVSKSKRYNVLDYDFYGDNILMITYVDLKRAKLVLISKDLDTLGYRSVPYEPNRLFKDCVGNLHVVCKDSIYQAYYSNNKLQLLSAKSIHDFEKILLPCVAQDSSSFYVVEKFGSKMVDAEVGLPFVSNPLALSYTCIHKKKRSKVQFIAIADEQKIAMSNDEEAFEARKAASGLKTFGDRMFAEKLLFTEIYAPLYTIKDSIYVFDYVNGNIKSFNKSLGLKKEVPVMFHKNLRFQNEMQVDQVSWKTFALFENDGITELKELNLNTGAIMQSHKIPFAFVNHVKVRDNYIYFIRKGKDYDDTRYLSRLKID